MRLQSRQQQAKGPFFFQDKEKDKSFLFQAPQGRIVVIAAARIAAVGTESMMDAAGTDPLLPPGFRFYPTEEELLSFFLRHRLAGTRPAVERLIPAVDIYSYHPADLQCMQKKKKLTIFPILL